MFPRVACHAAPPAKGVSGPAALKLSAFGARVLNEGGYRGKLVVNWMAGNNPSKACAAYYFHFYMQTFDLCETAILQLFVGCAAPSCLVFYFGLWVSTAVSFFLCVHFFVW